MVGDARDNTGMLSFQDERPLKLSEMARVLGVSVAWLRAEGERGAIPCVKADRGMLFDYKTVVALLAERARRGDRGEGVRDA